MSGSALPGAVDNLWIRLRACSLRGEATSRRRGGFPGPVAYGAVTGRRIDLVARTFSSLRTRNFRLFFIGQLISNSGNWLTTVAITLLVLHRTGSGAAVGLLSVCQFGPILVLSAWAGLVADRSDKRHLLYITQSLEMTQSFVLAALAFIPGTPLWAFYVTALAGGVMLAFDNPGRRSFVNEMVGHDDVTNAVTLYSAMVNLSRLVGPALGGLLIVTLGYGWCFTVDGISYLIVLAALVMMRAGELRRPPVTPRGRGQIRDGIRYVAATPVLWVTFSMLLIIGILSYNFTVVFPLFVERGLHGDDAQYTLVYSSFSAGAIVGTLFIARRTSVGLRAIVAGSAAFGASLLGLAFVPDVTVAYPVVAVVGATSVAYMTATTAIAQLRAGPQMVGRVLALQTVLMIGTTPVGGPLLGLAADAAGGRAPVIIGGAGALLASLVGLTAGRRHLARGVAGGEAAGHEPVENSPRR
jgi:MFS family permease